MIIYMHTLSTIQCRASRDLLLSSSRLLHEGASGKMYSVPRFDISMLLLHLVTLHAFPQQCQEFAIVLS